MPVGTIAIDLDAADTYSYVVAHRAVVRSLTLRNVDVDPARGDVVVRVFVESPTGTPLLHERTFEVPAVPVGASTTFRAVRIEPNHRELALLDEQVVGHLVVEVNVARQVAGVHRQPIAFAPLEQIGMRVAAGRMA